MKNSPLLQLCEKIGDYTDTIATAQQEVERSQGGNFKTNQLSKDLSELRGLLWEIWTKETDTNIEDQPNA
jgi:hypothetical protein